MSFEKARLDLFESLGVPMTPRRITDDAGKETYCLVRGTGEVPLVMVHGGLSEASNWARLVSRMPERFVVCVDRPGCGLTHSVDYSSYDSDDYRNGAASWLKSVVEGLGVEKVDLLGNSMGGFFSMCFALAHPGRVRRLVFAGAPAGLDRYLPPFIRLMASPIGGLMQKITRIEDPATLRKRVFSMLVADASRASDQQLEVSILSNQLPGVQRAARTMLKTVATPFGWRKTLYMRERAKQLQVPTLFLWGDQDAFAGPASGREVAAALPNGRLQIIEDAGHLPWVDQPEVVARAIEAFLAKDPARKHLASAVAV